MPGFCSPSKGEPLLLIPEYSGINKGQRVPDKSKTAHRKPLVKCFLTMTWDSPGRNTGVGCHFLLQCMKVKSESEVAQSYLTLHDPMDCSPPGSSIHGILQARVLEWGAIAFSIHTTVLHNSPLCMNPQKQNLKQRAGCKVTLRFSTV